MLLKASCRECSWKRSNCPCINVHWGWCITSKPAKRGSTAVVTIYILRACIIAALCVYLQFLLCRAFFCHENGATSQGEFKITCSLLHRLFISRRDSKASWCFFLRVKALLKFASTFSGSIVFRFYRIFSILLIFCILIFEYFANTL